MVRFNGSLFTVNNTVYGPDYRRWGGGYWRQNIQLPYWSMLESGDFDKRPHQTQRPKPHLRGVQNLRGKITKLTVTPASRRKDIVVPKGIEILE